MGYLTHVWRMFLDETAHTRVFVYLNVQRESWNSFLTQIIHIYIYIYIYIYIHVMVDILNLKVIEHISFFWGPFSSRGTLWQHSLLCGMGYRIFSSPDPNHNFLLTGYTGYDDVLKILFPRPFPAKRSKKRFSSFVFVL